MTLRDKLEEITTWGIMGALIGVIIAILGIRAAERDGLDQFQSS